MPICIYCDREKSDDQFSVEHIWPNALGGSFLPSELFQTRNVCKFCNDKCGLFVDGAFIKSWIVQNEISRSAHDYLDPSRPSIAPLTYLGIMTDFPVPDKWVCERWLGLAGEHIYHVRPRDEERWDSYASGDIIKGGRNRGRTYLTFTSSEAYWIWTAILSFSTYFAKTQRCVLNWTLDPNSPDLERETILFPPPDLNDPIQASEVAYIKQRTGGRLQVEGQFEIGSDFRFLCKLGLGLGHQLLKEPFAKTQYSKTLREGLDTRSFQEQTNCRVRGSRMIDEGDAGQELARSVGWAGAWTITIRLLQDMLTLTVISPALHFRSVVISDDPTLWADGSLSSYVGGQSFIVVPQQKRTWGPISDTDLITANVDDKFSPPLAELSGLRTSLSDLPPKQPNQSQ